MVSSRPRIRSVCCGSWAGSPCVSDGEARVLATRSRETQEPADKVPALLSEEAAAGRDDTIGANTAGVARSPSGLDMIMPKMSTAATVTPLLHHSQIVFTR